MNNLDNREKTKELDPSDMYDAIRHFPDQVRQAILVEVEPGFSATATKRLKNIIVCGMGGSAIGGELAQSVLYETLPVPMYICRNYVLPGCANANSLVIASSYSGNTEETLTAFEQARSKNCHLFAITSGGKLLRTAESTDIAHITLPTTNLQPRAALGYLFVSLMMLLNRLGFSPYGAKEFESLAAFLDKRAMLLESHIPSEDNPAKQLALRLYGRIPIIYSGPQMASAAATRFKGQINENAKMPAFANQFPEMNHNELVGWKVIQAFRDYLRILILRDREDHIRVAARMDIVKKMIEKEKIEITEIQSEGEDALQRIFSLIQLGDFVSYYLAILNNVDPTPVAPISFLKEELAKIG